jgi:hypothetical protein
VNFFTSKIFLENLNRAFPTKNLIVLFAPSIFLFPM